MNRLYKIKEASEYLQLAPSTLYKMVCYREAPFAIKIGRSVRFDRVKMDEWLNKQHGLGV